MSKTLTRAGIEASREVASAPSFPTPEEEGQVPLQSDQLRTIDEGRTEDAGSLSEHLIHEFYAIVSLNVYCNDGCQQWRSMARVCDVARHFL